MVKILKRVMVRLTVGLLYFVIIAMIELLGVGWACCAGVLLNILIMFDLHSSCCYMRYIGVAFGRNSLPFDLMRDWIFRGYCTVYVF
jgi:hypothetical protein